jgi:hypothetical protein
MNYRKMATAMVPLEKRMSPPTASSSKARASI